MARKKRSRYELNQENVSRPSKITKREAVAFGVNLIKELIDNHDELDIGIEFDPIDLGLDELTTLDQLLHPEIASENEEESKDPDNDFEKKLDDYLNKLPKIWRDKTGSRRLGQIIFGKHEWIPTNNTPKVFTLATEFTCAGQLKIANAILMAMDLLRTRTQYLILKNAQLRTRIFVTTEKTASELLDLQGHAGALYKKKGGKLTQCTIGQTDWHNELRNILIEAFIKPLEKLIETKEYSKYDSIFINYFSSLLKFIQEKFWDGNIGEEKDSDTLKSIKCDYYMDTKGTKWGEKLYEMAQIQKEWWGIQLDILVSAMNAILFYLENEKSILDIMKSKGEEAEEIKKSIEYSREKLRGEYPQKKLRGKTKSSSLSFTSSFLTTTLSDESVLLNGMKVIFDQSVSAYPVTLQSKTEPCIPRTSLPRKIFAEQNSVYSQPFARRRTGAIAISGIDTSTNQDDWKNAGKTCNLQYNQDIKLWLNTIYPVNPSGYIYSEGNEEKRKIIQRIFSVLRFGELKYRVSEENDEWMDWDKPIASALSHGGRVLIRIKIRAYDRIYRYPKIKNTFWNWLVTGNFEPSDIPKTNDIAGLKTRMAATHLVELNEEGEPKEIKLKGIWGKIKAIQEGHYGMNIPLGGEGGENAKGETILSDGLHGHLYFRYDVVPDTPSNTWDCSIMIGCETTRPPDFEGTEGEGHLGTGHSLLGTSQKVSATGGNKWADMPDELSKVGDIDCIRIDIDSVQKLLKVTTFGEFELSSLGEDKKLGDNIHLSEIINQYAMTDLGRGIFELHDGYRNVVKGWLG